MSRLVIRADGGAGVGAGHLARCFALAQAWCDAGGEAVLASNAPPSWWVERYATEGVPTVGPDEGHVEPGDWAVVDGYSFGLAETRRFRGEGARVLVVDDHGSMGTYEADAILDGNLGASEDAYVRRDADADLMLGTRFVPLRREFHTARSAERIVADSARTALAAVGGSPEPSVRALMDATAARPELRHLSFVRLDGVADVAQLMRESDLALTAAGSTCWELCCMGVPAVVVAVAVNQQPVASALAKAGAAVDAGRYEDLDPGRLAHIVAALAASKQERSLLADNASRLVDGLGAKRVVARLRAQLLALRPVQSTDCELLFSWRNDPVTRAAAFNTEPIAWAEHVAWFQHRVADPRCHVYIASEGGSPIGQIRFDVASRRAEVSVSLAPERRAMGWGPVIIAAGTRTVLRDDPAVDEVVAKIRPENRASITAFDRAGFVERSTGETDVVQYAVRRHGPRD